MGELVKADIAIIILIHLLEQPLHLRTEGGVLCIAVGDEEGERVWIQNIEISSRALLHKLFMPNSNYGRGGGRRELGEEGETDLRFEANCSSSARLS